MSASLSRRSLVQATGAALASAALPALAQASWPSRPIRIVVPYTAGGFTDQMARLLTLGLQKQFGQSVVIDNKPGANSIIGVDAVAKSTPDGHTFGVVIPAFTANTTLYPKLPYDPLKDLVPVALVSSSPIVMAAPINSPFKSYADVVAAAKGKPDALTLGYSGNGTVAHLAGELAENAADIKLRHIPYKGAAQAMTDLVGGQIDLYMSSVPTLLGQVRNGKLKVIAITSAKRSPQLPDVPTLAESGYKGFEAVTWFGILAPAGTPTPILAQLNKAINAALQQPDVADKLRSEGGDVLGGTAEQFSALLKAEVPRWAKIVKDSGASLD